MVIPATGCGTLPNGHPRDDGVLRGRSERAGWLAAMLKARLVCAFMKELKFSCNDERQVVDCRVNA